MAVVIIRKQELKETSTRKTRNQEQIEASHEIDGVRKEKERLTAASLTREMSSYERK